MESFVASNLNRLEVIVVPVIPIYGLNVIFILAYSKSMPMNTRTVLAYKNSERDDGESCMPVLAIDTEQVILVFHQAIDKLSYLWWLFKVT